MFSDSAKDLYNKYHNAEVQVAKDYWLKCLEIRLASGIEKEHANYYINRIKSGREAKDNE